MIHPGLNKIGPDKRDYSLLHSFAGVTPDPGDLPDNFSIYDGRPIPNQNLQDTRFTPALPPIPFGCTGETAAFECGIEDGKTYDPEYIYRGTKPYIDTTGRDIRDVLQFLIDNGPDGSNKRLAYFNCYGSGKISDFNAARIALWINQIEKRGVYAGTWWYPEFESPNQDGTLPLPSFNTQSGATLHCHLITGWRKNTNGVIELEDISWQGEDYANAGVDYITEEIYDALLAQPYTGAFTITKVPANSPVPVGYQALFDHVVYSLAQFVRNLFHA